MFQGGEEEDEEGEIRRNPVYNPFLYLMRWHKIDKQSCSRMFKDVRGEE